jgi:protein-S-isoprenylcysteine O-methyltransferase Ste14
MTGVHPHLLLAGVVQPYVNTHSVTLLLWVTINLISFAFEFNQWATRREEARKADRGSLAVLLSCTAVGLLVLILSTTLVPAATIRPAAGAFAVGIVVYLAGFAMRRWSEHSLGRYFTFAVMTSADQPVITTGPYRIVRHPGYTGVMLVVVGAGAVAGNWIGLIGFTALILLPLLYRIRVEETALLDALGERYRSYAAGHKRLVPLVW